MKVKNSKTSGDEPEVYEEVSCRLIAIEKVSIPTWGVIVPDDSIIPAVESRVNIQVGTYLLNFFPIF